MIVKVVLLQRRSVRAGSSLSVAAEPRQACCQLQLDVHVDADEPLPVRSASCYAKVAYPAVVEGNDPDPSSATRRGHLHRGLPGLRRTDCRAKRCSPALLQGDLPRPAPTLRSTRRPRLFGDAVLTKAAIEGTDNHAFQAQPASNSTTGFASPPQVRVDVCTAHLNTRATTELAGNDAPCVELAALLARRTAARTVIFGGHVNRRRSCAPDGAWTRTDNSAQQAAGLQHVYGSAALRMAPSAEVVPAAHTDHDVLLVRAHLATAIAQGVRCPTEPARSPANARGFSFAWREFSTSTTTTSSRSGTRLPSSGSPSDAEAKSPAYGPFLHSRPSGGPCCSSAADSWHRLVRRRPPDAMS